MNAEVTGLVSERRRATSIAEREIELGRQLARDRMVDLTMRAWRDAQVAEDCMTNALRVRTSVMSCQNEFARATGAMGCGTTTALALQDSLAGSSDFGASVAANAAAVSAVSASLFTIPWSVHTEASRQSEPVVLDASLWTTALDSQGTVAANAASTARAIAHATSAAATMWGSAAPAWSNAALASLSTVPSFHTIGAELASLFQFLRKRDKSPTDIPTADLVVDHVTGSGSFKFLSDRAGLVEVHDLFAPATTAHLASGAASRDTYYDGRSETTFPLVDGQHRMLSTRAFRRVWQDLAQFLAHSTFDDFAAFLEGVRSVLVDTVARHAAWHARPTGLSGRFDWIPSTRIWVLSHALRTVLPLPVLPMRNRPFGGCWNRT